MKPLRQPTTRPIISYQPRREPARPVHAVAIEGFRDVYRLHGNYVAFVLSGDRFRQSPAFSLPASAQRWADQMRQENEMQVRTAQPEGYRDQ